jgi:hypothetical protein
MVTRTERTEPDSRPHGSGLGPPISEYWSSESVMIGLQGCFWHTGLLEGNRPEGVNLELFCHAQLQIQVTSAKCRRRCGCGALLCYSWSVLQQG